MQINLATNEISLQGAKRTSEKGCKVIIDLKERSIEDEDLFIDETPLAIQ
jgi:hypothetical protein